MAKVWFITGSSSGLGRSLTEAVLAKGDKVAATARKPERLNDLLQKYPEQLLPLQLDVTDYPQVRTKVAEAVAHFGRIDVLVNNAGFGIVGAAEAYTEEQVRSQLETNLYAPIEVTRIVLPYMRRQRSGRILQISSIGGRVGNPGLTIYQAAKFGLGGFTEAVGKEVAPLGIYVTSVEPGGFRTKFMDTLTYAPQIEGYETTVGLRQQLFSSPDFIPMGDPAKAAQAMIGVVESPQPPVHLVLGSEAVSMVQQANATRQAEMEAYMHVSTSTDHEGAQNVLESSLGRQLFGAKK